MIRWLSFALLLLPVGTALAQQENKTSKEDVAPVKGDPEPERRVRLVRETGGHVAKTLALAFTPDSKKLVSMAEDRTVQIWDVATKERLVVIRPPLGVDGLGGLIDDWVGQPLVLDRKGERVSFCVTAKNDKEQMVSTTFVCSLATGLSQTVTGVGPRDFSLDGKSLAVAAGRTVRLVDIATDRIQHTADIPSQNTVVQLAFAPNGKTLAVVAQDFNVYLLDAATLKPLHKWSVSGARSLLNVVWADDQTLVCRGEPDAKTLVVLDADTGKLKHAHSLEELWKGRPKGTDHHIVEIHAMTGSKQVFVRTSFRGAEPREGAKPFGGFLFNWATGAVKTSFFEWSWFGSRAAAIAPDRSFAAQGHGDWNDIVLWNPRDGKSLLDGKTDGRLRAKVNGALGGIESLRWLSDNVILYKQFPHFEPAEVDLSLLTLKPIPEDVFKKHSKKIADLVRGDELPLEALKNRDRYERGIMHQWQRLSLVGKLPDFEITGGAHPQLLQISGRAVGWNITFVRDGRIAVLAQGSPVLQVFDSATGKRLYATRVAQSQLRSLAVSPDRRYVLIGSLDQTLTIYNPATGKVLLTIFPTGTDWIAWTPEGYYAGTPGGERHVGWHVENGPDKLAGFYPIERFRKTFYRPDVIQRILETGSVEAALKAADARLGQETTDVKIESVLPPRAVLTVDQSKLPMVKLKVQAEASSKKQPITALRLLVDGRPLAEGAAYKTLSPGRDNAEAEWSVTLPPGQHQLTVLARCPDSSSKSNTVEIAVADPTKQNILHVLAIGVNDYEDGTLKLDFAAKDAQDIAATFQKRKGELFTDVHGQALVNARARKDAILKQLADLRKQAKPNDLVVIFFAGHGVKEKEKFYLLPVEAKTNDLAKTAISGDELRKSLGEFPCQVLLMLDACHSSGSLKNFRPAVDDITRSLTDDDCGVAVLCAAMAHEKALEKEGNGLFTKAIVDGLQRRDGAPYNTFDRMMYIHHLHSYVFDRVSHQSGGRQHPFLSLPWVVESFPVAKFDTK